MYIHLFDIFGGEQCCNENVTVTWEAWENTWATVQKTRGALLSPLNPGCLIGIRKPWFTKKTHSRVVFCPQNTRFKQPTSFSLLTCVERPDLHKSLADWRKAIKTSWRVLGGTLLERLPEFARSFFWPLKSRMDTNTNAFMAKLLPEIESTLLMKISGLSAVFREKHMFFCCWTRFGVMEAWPPSLIMQRVGMLSLGGVN